VARLVLEKLDCWYGRTHAVDQIDLVVEDGELCVLLGPSGCGKTSTLRMIAGLVHPSGGEIYLDGRPISGIYPGYRDVAMVFQSYALYPHMTVRQHFAFPLKAQKLREQEIARRVEEMADFLEMRDLLDRYPHELSAGEQQRAAIGRALIRRPRILLFDEPLSNLDAMLRVEMRTRLRRLQQDLGITTVYVTHDQVEAQAIADKIVVMNLGRIQQVGTPQEVYARPVNRFVAGFIGTPPMNFVEGRLRWDDGRVVLRAGRLDIPLPPGCAPSGLGPDYPAVLGVRPEHLNVHPALATGGVACKVSVIEPQGNQLVLSLQADGVSLVACTDKRELGFRPEVGQDVWVTLQPGHIHLFDQQTEKRLVQPGGAVQ